jgi:hypothetical protein
METTPTLFFTALLTQFLKKLITFELIKKIFGLWKTALFKGLSARYGEKMWKILIAKKMAKKLKKIRYSPAVVPTAGVRSLILQSSLCEDFFGFL